jgi:hypothetical protein
MKKRKRDSTVEEMRIARELKAEEMERKAQLIRNKEELARRLVFQTQMGNRVRAAVRDREAGRRVVEENNANTLRIGVLRKLIEREEKDQ